MKNSLMKSLVCLCLVLASISAQAAVRYWDLNGSAAGAGSTAPSGTWDTASANWNDAADGTGTATNFAAGDIAVFSAGGDATGSYTITGTGVTFGSVTNEDGICTLGTTAFPLGSSTWTIKAGAQLRYAGTSAFPFANCTAGSMIILDGGRIRNSTTGNAGNFLGPASTMNTGIYVTTNGGTFDVSSSSTIILNILGSTGTTNLISGPGGITKVGASVLAIASACTYAGSTTINAGEIRIRTSANRLPITTDVIVNSPGILNLNSVAGSGAIGQQIGSLSGNGTVGLGSSVLVIGGTNSTIFTGSISNTANVGASGSTATAGNGVTKQGTGTITFTGTNGFTGLLTLTAGGINVTTNGVLFDPVCDLQVNGGTLSLTNAAQGVENLYGAGGTIILNSGHTMTVNPLNASRGTSFSGVIAGTGGINKIGAPAEYLLGANTYSGPTVVNVGKLVMSTASTGAGGYTVADSASLGARVASAGTSLNMSDLTVGNSTMEFDFNSLGYPSAAIVHDAGAIALSGTVAVNVMGLTNGGGPVTLLDYAGVRSGSGSFVPGAFPPRINGTVTDDTANSKVIFSATGGDSLIWVSDPAGTWDVNNGGNTIWKLASNNSANYYQESAGQGDIVRFDDTATGTTTVSIPAPVIPYRVTVDNPSRSYTFTGDGKISGIGAVTKSGAADLTIATTNDYSGGTILNAGTVNAGNNSIFGTGKLTINGGTLRSDSTTDRSLSMPVDLNGDVTFGDPVKTGNLTFATGAWTITGASRQINVDTINAAINVAIGQDVPGRGLTKVGNGTLSLAAVSTFSGGFNLNAGTLRVNGSAAILANSPVTLADGVTLATTSTTARTITAAYTVNGNFTIGQAAGGTAALTLAGSMNLGGTTRTITLANSADTISAVITNGGLTLASAGTLTLSGANGYNGDTTVNGGTLSLTGLSTGTGDYYVNAGGTLQLNGTATAGNGTGTIRLLGGNLVGSATRASKPLPNPVIMSADTTMPVATTGTGLREFPFSGSFTTSGGTLTVKNTGTTDGIWNIRFEQGGLNFTRPIVMGVSGDTGGTRVTAYNTNGSPDQVFSGDISGYGAFYRAAAASTTGGTTVLSAANTYSGGTVVSGGTLLINNTSGSGTGSGEVTVSSGGTLGGTGIIAGLVTVNSGGVIGAGASAGILTLNNGLDLSAGGTNVWELAVNSTNNPGTSFDQLALTGGNLVLGGTSRLHLKFTGSATFPDASNPFWQEARAWKVIDLSGGGAVNPGPTVFAGVDGVQGNSAGTFTTAAAADGIYLSFTPRVTPPQPYIEPNVVGAGTTSAQVSWSSMAGASYTVQYKTNLNQVGWLDLTNLTATGSTTAIIDNTSPVPNERYYRVIWP